MSKIFIESYKKFYINSITIEDELVNIINEEEYISYKDKDNKEITLVYESGSTVALGVERFAKTYGYTTYVIGDEVYQGSFDAGLFFYGCNGVETKEFQIYR